MIPVFDGHNDAITREDAADFATGREGGHLDVPRAREGGLAGGIFALFTPTPGAEHIDFDGEGRMEVELAAPIGPEVAAATTSQGAGRLLGLERDGHLRIVRTIEDLDAARADGVLAAVIHHEGAEAIDPGLEALELWYAAGCARSGRCGAGRTRSPTACRSRSPPRPTPVPASPPPAAGSCAAAPSSGSRST
jgi:membrane dipeptidase